MNGEETKRALGMLERVTENVGELRGEIRATRADVQLVRVEQQEQGKRIASLPCDRHARRISEALRALHAEEVTGRVEIARGETRRATLDTVWKRSVQTFAILGAVATLAGAVWAMWR